MPAPEGSPTRGTTGTNRLRRVDRWIAQLPALRDAPDPLVVDLGFGASGVTAFELATRLRPLGAEVLGLELDPDRVATAREQLASVRRGETAFAADLPVSFGRGGFEIPAPRDPLVVRAYNVLRQYDEAEVPAAWERMTSRLAPGGVLVEGTCDEIGRVSAWVAVTAAGPQSLSISLSLPHLERPSIVAERLPKALIHHNVDGERVHDLIRDLDAEWDRAAGYAAFGPVQRWLAATDALAVRWRILTPKRRCRLGELTVPWSSVSPL
ncbi:class I SAM-dependent methyltransferase [Microbacterium indicum]|uniref:class I SAM-dependent methyltransferase n=1 Tax=Microbacterium indicum TaxID=358100 RepID=UPI000A042E55|nr:class I SAM-dependent methyltransferase [Microbacterium indicum]